MITSIKTKTLLTIINPQKEQIIYNGEKIQIDFSEIKKYVLNPVKYNIFEKEETPLIDFYKNIALYIINNEKQKIVSINLDNSPIIETGLFEFIKAVYNKEPSIYIKIPENGDNQLLINSQKLLPIEDLNLEFAKDKTYTGLKSLFSNTTKQKTVENDKFFWKEDKEDLYSNETFILQEIEKIYKKQKITEKTSEQLTSLLIKVDKNLLNNKTFQFNILELNISELNHAIIFDKHKEFIKIDLNDIDFLNLLNNQIENKKFSLLHLIYKKEKTRGTNKTNFDFSEIINKPEVIEYFISSQYRYAQDDTQFSLYNNYQNLNQKNQENPDIILNFLLEAKKTTMHNESFICMSDILKLPHLVYENKEILKIFISHILPDDLFHHFKKTNQNPTLLSDKNFILENAPFISATRLIKLIDLFLPEKELTKDYIINLIQSKPTLYRQFLNNKKFLNFYNDIDIIMQSYKYGLPQREIRLETMLPFLSNTSNNPNIEHFKLNYLITNDHIQKTGDKLFNNKEEIDFFNLKYNKPEYLFFKKEYFYNSLNKQKILTKIKDETKIIEIIETIKNLKSSINISLEFDSNLFFQSLHPSLKEKSKIVEALIPHGLKYSTISEPLIYNFDLILSFIKNNPSTLSIIPPPLLNDIDFSLNLAKLMDNNKIPEKFVPPLIAKFFENQEVTSDYYKYLKSYINMMDLKENHLKQEHNEIVKSKNKI